MNKLPEVDRRLLNLNSVKDSQLLQPLFEFSGACAGCGETPYLKLLSQKRHRVLVDLWRQPSGLLGADQSTYDGVYQQRRRVEALVASLTGQDSSAARDLLSLADVLVKRSLWIVGGDGWAYDIGYGGLDHVLASGRNVNVLVLDTEVYSNTGGQSSKSTPRGAVAKFPASGKQLAKKDLGLLAIAYGDIYVGRIAMGANDAHTVRTFLEAEAYDGPSLIIAYSVCIAHGYDLRFGLEQQKKAVLSGHWPLYRYDPRLAHDGSQPFQLDSKPPSIPLQDYAGLIDTPDDRLDCSGGSLSCPARDGVPVLLIDEATSRPTPTDAEFERLIGEAAAAPFYGWDLSWLDSRRTITDEGSAGPIDHYDTRATRLVNRAGAVLDIGTGDGRRFAGYAPFPPVAVAAEGHAPNVKLTAQRLAPLGVQVVRTDEN